MRRLLHVTIAAMLIMGGMLSASAQAQSTNMNDTQVPGIGISGGHNFDQGFNNGFPQGMGGAFGGGFNNNGYGNSYYDVPCWQITTLPALNGPGNITLLIDTATGHTYLLSYATGRYFWSPLGH